MIIDLRSDTVTKPTPEMRRAMAEAEVGDDVYGEDPTVNRLETKAAELMGKEAALFVPSGTMANQVAVLSHTSRGNEVLLDPEAHIAYYEVGSPAMFGGVQLRGVPGLLDTGGANALCRAIRNPDIHLPESRLVCLENTFNRGGGTVLPIDEMETVYSLSRELGLKVHLDGARIFNAAIASGIEAREYAKYCDSVMFCLSKGLCAPVGSVLAGDKDFILRSRKYRKALGGGMRQAGILAAAGLEALKLIPRLEEDHRNAGFLAEELSRFKGLEINMDTVQTNMVIVDVTGTGMDAPRFVQALGEVGVRTGAFSPSLVRFVTHKDISRGDVEAAVGAIASVLKQ